MKKSSILLLAILSSIVIISLITINQIQLTKALSNPPSVPSPPSQQDIENKYLKQEWGKIIANNSIIGPVHLFFSRNPMAFRILFAMPYEFSPTFICILILWILVAFQLGGLIRSFGFLKDFFSTTGLGILGSIILAQIGLYYFIASTFVSILISKEAWFVRFLIILAGLGIIILESYLNRMLKGQIRASKKAAEQHEVKQSQKIIKATAKGLTEAQIAQKKREGYDANDSSMMYK